MTHPYVANLESIKEQRCSRIGDTSAVRERVEAFTSDTASGFAKQSVKRRNVKSSRVVPEEHLCAVKEWHSDNILEFVEKVDRLW